MEIIDQLLANPFINQIVLWILGSVAVATFFEDAIANIVGRIPVVGKLLGPLARRLSLNFWNWLKRRAESAEKVVRDTEAVATQTAKATRQRVTSQNKKAAAMSVLAKTEPGMTAGERDVEIEAALARLKADATLQGVTR